MAHQTAAADEVGNVFDNSDIDDGANLYCVSAYYSSDDESEKEEKGAEKSELSESSSNEDERPDDTSTTEDCWSDSKAHLPDFPFSGSPGLKINLPPNCKPMDVFSLFFDDNVVKELVRLVNKKAEEIRELTPKIRSRPMAYWKPLDEQELRTFFGLTLLMGTVKMPSYKHFWSMDPLYRHPIFGKSMGRWRYELILRCLRLYDPETAWKTDHLHKVNLIIDYFLQKMTEFYYPNRNLSLGEALLLWHGRLSFREHILNKRPKNGIKFYELCTTDGIVVNLLLYKGKGSVVTDDEKSLPETIVLKLMENYLDNGHAIFLDNFYSSVKLTEMLSARNTYVCGTLRKDRKGNPSEVIGAKLQKGQAIWKRKNDVVVTKWKGKQEVLMITNMHKHSMEAIKTEKGAVVIKPMVLLDYNINMSATDRCDQMISYYANPRKSVRWYVQVLLHILEIMIWNSHCFYNSVTDKKICYLQFRDEICLALITKNCEGRMTVNELEPKLSTTNHRMMRLRKSKRCRNCYKSGKRKETVFACANCPKIPGLCPGDCFEKFHSTD